MRIAIGAGARSIGGFRHSHNQALAAQLASEKLNSQGLQQQNVILKKEQDLVALADQLAGGKKFRS